MMKAAHTAKQALVADDDEASRRAVALLLKADGYDVVECCDGEEALYCLAAAIDGADSLPDLLVLDFCMPGLSGIGLLRILRRFSRLPPTILMTGFPDPSVEIFARNVGVATFIRKPLEWEALRSAVRDAASVHE